MTTSIVSNAYIRSLELLATGLDRKLPGGIVIDWAKLRMSSM